MSSFDLFEEAVRRAFVLNIRYVGAISGLAADYLKDLSKTISELSTSQSTEGALTPAVASAVQPPQPRQQAGTMVLEAEAGGKAVGVFLVQNNLRTKVSAKVAPSNFVDEAGRKVDPNLTFDPDVINLEPHEQMIVRVVAAIDRTAKPGVSYRGELNIPELAGTRVPVAIRRRLVRRIRSPGITKRESAG